MQRADLDVSMEPRWIMVCWVIVTESELKRLSLFIFFCARLPRN